jgi:hypothetical protein
MASWQVSSLTRGLVVKSSWLCWRITKWKLGPFNGCFGSQMHVGLLEGVGYN